MGDPGDPNTREGGETATHGISGASCKVLESWNEFEKEFLLVYKETNWPEPIPSRFTNLCKRVEILGKELNAFAEKERLGPVSKKDEGVRLHGPPPAKDQVAPSQKTRTGPLRSRLPWVVLGNGRSKDNQVMGFAWDR